MKVLVVEDDTVQQTLLTAIFEKMGISGLFCKTAESGMEQLAKASFDLVMIDMGLPGKSGLYLLRKMRESLKTRETPVLVVTADRSRETIIQCTQYKVSDYLIKPVPAELMSQKLRILQSIIVISKEATDKGAFSNVAVEHSPGITRFNFGGQFSRYSVQQFQNLYTPLMRAQTQEDTLILNLASIPTFGPAQAEPLRLISDLLEPKQALIIGGKNFGPLMPMIHNFATRLFMNDGDAMKFLTLKASEG
jgi:DNA-binding response OmpR family regulator